MQPIFFSRELSWIEFNARVLEEAKQNEVPLFERLKFLGIVTSNFDEFFMVRVASLKRQHKNAPEQKDSAGLTAQKQLQKISERVHELLDIQYKTLNDELLPRLAEIGISYIPKEKYNANQTLFLEELFRTEILPLLTPLRTEKNIPFPHVSNLKLHAAFLLKPMFEQNDFSSQFSNNENKQENNLIAIVQVPTSIKRIIWLPSENQEQKKFTLIDDVIQNFGTHLFPGFSVEETLIFKVARDADFAVEEQRDADFAIDKQQDTDFIQAMEEVLERRQTSFPVRMNCNCTSKILRDFLKVQLHLEEQDVYEANGIPDLSIFTEIANLEGFERQKYPTWKHFKNKSFKKENIWDTLKQKDMLLHVPYESYDPVVNFLNKAADDAKVLAIKITLYRTSGNSPIVNALEKAARNGKNVTAFVELKARFDEQKNISWAQKLKHAGVIVVYSIANLKVHAKLLLIIRRETDSIHRYVHLSTGNYNDKTAKTYADLSLFTSQPEIANDATIFFNMISGYSAIQTMKRLIMAPINLKSRLIEMIEREIPASKDETPGFIVAKMNSLGHEEIIQALYKASQAGVKILLNIRGVCTLAPGVKGLSENITVVSVIDRYLEHSRIFYFQNSGDEELYLSSADWLPRNLDRRVELMFPITQKEIVAEIKETLFSYFSDNKKSHYLQNTGKWVKRIPLNNEIEFRAQEEFYTKFKRQSDLQNTENPKEFIVRRL